MDGGLYTATVRLAPILGASSERVFQRGLLKALLSRQGLLVFCDRFATVQFMGICRRAMPPPPASGAPGRAVPPGVRYPRRVVPPASSAPGRAVLPASGVPGRAVPPGERCPRASGAPGRAVSPGVRYPRRVVPPGERCPRASGAPGRAVPRASGAPGRSVPARRMRRLPCRRVGWSVPLRSGPAGGEPGGRPAAKINTPTAHGQRDMSRRQSLPSAAPNRSTTLRLVTAYGMSVMGR